MSSSINMSSPLYIGGVIIRQTAMQDDDSDDPLARERVRVKRILLEQAVGDLEAAIELAVEVIVRMKDGTSSGYGRPSTRTN